MSNTIIDLLFNLVKLIGKGYTPNGGNGIYYCSMGFIVLYIISIVVSIKIKKHLGKECKNTKNILLLISKEKGKLKNRLFFINDICIYIRVFIIVLFVIFLIAICFFKKQDRLEYITSDLSYYIITFSFIVSIVFIFIRKIISDKRIVKIKSITKYLLSIIIKLIPKILVGIFIAYIFYFIGIFIAISSMWKDNVIRVDFDSNGVLKINTEIYNGKYEDEPIDIEFKDNNDKSIAVATLSKADCHLISSTSVTKRINYPYNNNIIQLKSITKTNKLYVYDLNQSPNLFNDDNLYSISIHTHSYYDDVVLYNSFIKNGDKYEFKESKMEEKYASNHGAEVYRNEGSNSDNVGVFVLGLLMMSIFFILPYIFLI